jgi:RNA polymerase sigma-70 factor, ECF subfamily
MPEPSELTQLLIDWSTGSKDALDKLMPLVYDELRSLARRYLSHESSGHTLQTTALVNEAYLRLIDQSRVQWQNRAHFFAIAAQMMRRILVDHARKQHYAKRGGGAVKLSLDDVALLSNEKAAELVALDEALEKFSELDARRSRVVELRFFGGLNNEEVAAVLGVSANTVMRDWNLARAWLYNAVTKT